MTNGSVRADYACGSVKRMLNAMRRRRFAIAIGVADMRHLCSGLQAREPSTARGLLASGVRWARGQGPLALCVDYANARRQTARRNRSAVTDTKMHTIGEGMPSPMHRAENLRFAVSGRFLLQDVTQYQQCRWPMPHEYTQLRLVTELDDEGCRNGKNAQPKAKRRKSFHDDLPVRFSSEPES